MKHKVITSWPISTRKGSTSSTIREKQIKNLSYTATPPGWLTRKELTIPTVGKKGAFTAEGRADRYNCFGKLLGRIYERYI